MIKLKIKPDNQTIEISKSSTLKEVLGNDPIYTLSIRKNGPPVGSPEATILSLLESKTIVAGDILWKVLVSDFGLPEFCGLLQNEISMIGSSNVITLNDKNAVIEVKIQNADMSLLISRLGTKKELNIMLTIGDDSTENFMVKLDVEGVQYAIYRMKTSASNFLFVPVAGILELPNVILTKIFKYLDAIDLCRISCVNKRLGTISEDEDTWKYLLENKYPLLEKNSTETFKIAYKRAFLQEKEDKFLEEERKKRQRVMEENIQNGRRSGSIFTGPMGPGFSAPIVPGMVGGQSDLDPFASNPLSMPGRGMVPRGGPIYGPDGNEIFQPGPGRGIGSDDFPYNVHNPMNPRNPRNNGNRRGPGFGSFQPPFM